jgi:uncharacterized Zn finger protein
MPRRRWDDPWQRYPASVPLPAEGGLVTSKRRGAMAETWWSRRFIDALESYGLGARMQRGRRYARSGQVLTLDVRTAVIAAQVQGSRRTPYLVTVSLPEPSARQWRRIESAMAAKIGFVARLLAGEVPPDLEGAFDTAGVALFPGAWRDVRADCSCPDWENPCKHIAAALYVFADQLDTDPWLLLRWRGRSSDELLGPLQNRSGDEPPADEIARWWPFPPGALARLTDVPPASASLLVDPDRPEAVLDQLEELDVVVAGVPFRDAIRAVYQHLPGVGGDGAVGPR